MIPIPTGKKSEGITVDWTAFIAQFKEVYLNHIRSTWASYYSKLKDPLEVHNREKALDAVNAFLLEPEKIAHTIIHDIFVNNMHILMENKAQLSSSNSY